MLDQLRQEDNYGDPFPRGMDQNFKREALLIKYL